MPAWTRKRAAHLIRGQDGQFKDWLGGREKEDLKKKENNFHGIATHIGKEYERQHGRPASVGQAVRFKTKSGNFHKQAFWYVRTPDGWRKLDADTRPPTAAEINDLINRSRKGRRT
jgi:hypothetical protein